MIYDIVLCLIVPALTEIFNIDLEQCEVLFPYSKVNEDELELERGQIVTILSKDQDDPGWWKGKLNGKVGVFPDNFVKIIKKSTQKPPLNKELSIEEKYDLTSLKKELDLRNVICNTQEIITNNILSPCG